MNILTVTGPLHREFGGPPMAATGVAASLSILGHQVKLLVCGQSIQDTQINSVFFYKLSQSGTEVIVLQRRNESKYGTVLRFHELKSIWRDVSKSELVILHQVFELQYIFIFPILMLLKKPYVVMPHGTLTSYQRKQHRLRKLLFYPATYSFLKSANGIFVATGQERNQLPSFLQRKGIIVGLGVDQPEQQNLNLTPKNQTFNLLYMGRIAKKKRLDIALQAFASASKKSNVPMKFIVCGSGEERDVALLKKLVIDLEIQAAVEFRGWVDFSEKQRAFLESDCFILTSEDENFAIAAAESLAYGIPCILSLNVALASLVAKHSAGIVFKDLLPLEIENAIIEISKIDREESRSAALRAASEISWDAISRQWETSIKRVLVRQI
jgi:glycosyltransferase involved in cell wall biosynthesis